MSLIMFRIDDRLIHGQVTTGWARALGLDSIVLANDRIAASDWEGELYLSVTPPEIETVLMPVDGVGPVIAGMELNDKRAILLVETVADARRIVDGGYRPGRINVGGVHHADGRRELLPYLFIGSQEAADLAHIAGLGIVLEARDVPGGKSLEVRRLLTVFGLGDGSGEGEELP
ncbi:PTS system mannose/fructose/N-acetylgalactosamine-transporter subunit IIB [candidate division KSB1 bacterium]